MNEILTVFTQNILPIFIVAAFGFILRRRFHVGGEALSKTAFYILSPALVFSSLVTTELPGGELAQLALFTLLSIASSAIIAALVGRLLRYSREQLAIFMLVVMFVNSGNYGLTLMQLRYGDAGVARAVVYYVTSTIVLYSAGILIASMGKMSWREALGKLVRLPPFLAALAAIFIYALGIPVPGPLMAGISLAGSAAIPVMLLILGIQLATLERGAMDGMVWPAVAVRLLVGPLIGIGIAALLGLTGLARSAAIIEASMPTAVVTIVFAMEFALPASSTARIVMISTLLSPITLALTITLLGL